MFSDVCVCGSQLWSLKRMETFKKHLMFQFSFDQTKRRKCFQQQINPHVFRMVFVGLSQHELQYVCSRWGRTGLVQLFSTSPHIFFSHAPPVPLGDCLTTLPKDQLWFWATLTQLSAPCRVGTLRNTGRGFSQTHQAVIKPLIWSLEATSSRFPSCLLLSPSVLYVKIRFNAAKMNLKEVFDPNKDKK